MADLLARDASAFVIIVVRAWTEPHPDHPFRAVVTVEHDGDIRRAAANTIGEVSELISGALAGLAPCNVDD